MSKRLAALTAILLLAANLSAGDPWKDKPYNQWDEKDLRKIMTESPWARVVQVENTWGVFGSEAELTPLPPSGGDSRDIRPDRQQTPQVRQATFVIRWGSSRTIRRALARNAVLHGVAEAEAEEFLAQEPREYQVVVLGPDMTPFAKREERDLKEIKQKSYLALRKSRAKLTPERVEMEGAPDSKKVVAVHFYFAKKTGAGEPSLSAEEKSADFVCQIGGTTLRTTFDFQKMNDRDGKDL